MAPEKDYSLELKWTDQLYREVAALRAGASGLLKELRGPSPLGWESLEAILGSSLGGRRPCVAWYLSAGVDFAPVIACRGAAVKATLGCQRFTHLETLGYRDPDVWIFSDSDPNWRTRLKARPTIPIGKVSTYLFTPLLPEFAARAAFSVATSVYESPFAIPILMLNGSNESVAQFLARKRIKVDTLFLRTGMNRERDIITRVVKDGPDQTEELQHLGVDWLYADCHALAKPWPKVFGTEHLAPGETIRHSPSSYLYRRPAQAAA
jgi:hypothetical protein